MQWVVTKILRSIGMASHHISANFLKSLKLQPISTCSVYTQYILSILWKTQRSVSAWWHAVITLPGSTQLDKHRPWWCLVTGMGGALKLGSSPIEAPRFIVRFAASNNIETYWNIATWCNMVFVGKQIRRDIWYMHQIKWRYSFLSNPCRWHILNPSYKLNRREALLHTFLHKMSLWTFEAVPLLISWSNK